MFLFKRRQLSGTQAKKIKKISNLLFVWGDCCIRTFMLTPAKQRSYFIGQERGIRMCLPMPFELNLQGFAHSKKKEKLFSQDSNDMEYFASAEQTDTSLWHMEILFAKALTAHWS